METQKGSYTLLADDNSQFSNNKDRRDGFKAHLVYNLILNGRIAFSDNQVICSSNLQSLVAYDPVILALFEQGFFDLAVRSDFDTESGVASLPSVHQAFVRERKIRFAANRYDETPALALIERHARPIPWSYDAIRTNYTATCQSLLLREFRPLLSDSEFDLFEAAIEAERERDDGLGREFLQNRLHEEAVRAGIRIDEDRRELIRRCTDAPYLSNLPSLIDLNPIYADEHRASFDLMRGTGLQLESTEGEKAPCRFDHAHYVAGLCRLTVDDIRFLQELPARQDYLRLSNGNISTEADFEAAFRAFLEFNLLVEDRIAARFPEIASRSAGDPDRIFYRQKAKDYGKAVGGDAVGILIGTALPFFPLSLCSQVIFDVGSWLRGEQPARSVGADVLERETARKRLEAHLGRSGAGAKLTMEDRPEPGSAFAKEIIVS
ncbi:MAG TPA: hypothetical protein VES64_08885 [Allosphingosinicella sp.]|nr:hypothetical protein [Allosphingosinicella sp.]